MSESSSSAPTRPPLAKPCVLQILPALNGGGVERGTVDVACFLKRAGASPIVVSEGGRLVHDLERAGVRHIALPVASKNPFVMRANIKRLAQIIKDFDVDIVHARSRAPAWSAFFAAKQTGAAFMTTFHAAYKYQSPLKKFYNSIMARGERVIAISSFIADHIHSVYGVAAEKIRLIPRGIDLFKFNPDNVTGERMATMSKNWGIPDGQKIIMCPGRLSPIKGQGVLLDALGILRKQRADFFCLLVGGDQGRTAYSAELWAKVEALNLSGMVAMPGDVADMPSAYMLADVVAATSVVPEGFGRTPVEAQAMGRPVIVSNMGGMRETVLAGETGWMVPPANPEALAEALNIALDLTPEQRAVLASRAISHVHAHFSMDQMCWATLDTYAELCNCPLPWALPDSAA